MRISKYAKWGSVSIRFRPKFLEILNFAPPTWFSLPFSRANPLPSGSRNKCWRSYGSFKHLTVWNFALIVEKSVGKLFSFKIYLTQFYSLFYRRKILVILQIHRLKCITEWFFKSCRSFWVDQKLVLFNSSSLNRSVFWPTLENISFCFLYLLKEKGETADEPVENFKAKSDFALAPIHKIII